jgi:NAD(P)-dependent dehydrogenase (short-subunit alcohol dehydrogenase family)
MSLHGQVVLVTGGAERVGRVIVTALARAGADVVINHWGTPQAAQATASEVAALGRRARIVEADIRDPDASRSMVEQVVDEFGRLDVLVNNASSFVERPFAEVTSADFDQSFDVNIRGPFFLCQAASRAMLQQGSGKIIAMVGESYFESWPDFAAHCCSKVALAKLMQVLAVALAPTVQCNAVCPASVLPPEDRSDIALAASRGEQWEKQDGVASDLSRLRQGRPEDVAEFVTYLASSTAYLTGAVLSIDGGKSAL